MAVYPYALEVGQYSQCKTGGVYVVCFYFLILPGLVRPGHSECTIHQYPLVRLDGPVLHCCLSMFPPNGMRCVSYVLSLFYNACNAEQRLLCFMIGCYIKLQAWMRASMALLDYATAQSFGLCCVASLWTPSVSCTPSRYALRMSERISLLSTFVSLFAVLVLPHYLSSLIILFIVETVMTIYLMHRHFLRGTLSSGIIVGSNSVKEKNHRIWRSFVTDVAV